MVYQLLVSFLHVKGKGLWKSAERRAEQHIRIHTLRTLCICLFIYIFMGAKECNMPNWTALIFFPAIFPCRSYCSHSLNNILHSLALFFSVGRFFSSLSRSHILYLVRHLLISCQCINQRELSTQFTPDLSVCLIPNAIIRPKPF